MQGQSLDEALEPGRPLSFLNHHILCGNSLLGTTPALIRDGIPDDAFKAIEGDDPKLCAEYRKQNKRERQQESLRGFHGDPWEQFGNLAAGLISIDQIADDRIEGVRQRQERFEELVNSSDYRYGGLLADAWCATFVWKTEKSEELPYPITEEQFRRIEDDPLNVPEVDGAARSSVSQRSINYSIGIYAFPDVFQVPRAGQKPENELCGWNGGFDVILGNPPWERVKLLEKEWFAERRPDIASAQRSSSKAAHPRTQD